LDGDHTETAYQAPAGGVVRTRDLQKGMEQAGGRDLGWFFDQWVDGTEPALTARHHLEEGAVVVDLEQKGPKPWRIGLRIAVETDRERVSRRVELTQRKETFRIPVEGTPLSVRIDDGAALPRPVDHERPWPMLIHQMRHEPDAAGRAEALLTIAAMCGAAAPRPECAGWADLLRERATEDPSRIVRQIAEKEIAPPR
jgi:aminopeptidase N